jgi:hypothetical protein
MGEQMRQSLFVISFGIAALWGSLAFAACPSGGVTLEAYVYGCPTATAPYGSGLRIPAISASTVFPNSATEYIAANTLADLTTAQTLAIKTLTSPTINGGTLGSGAWTVSAGSPTRYLGFDSGNNAVTGSPAGSGNMTGSGATTTNNILCSNNTGGTLNTAIDCGYSTSTFLARASNLSDVANAATARNNLLTATGGGTPTRYIGLDGSNIVVTGTPAGGGGLTVGTTSIASGTNYGLLFNNTGSVLGNTGVGTAGQVLTSNGAGVAPSFQAGGGGGSGITGTTNGQVAVASGATTIGSSLPLSGSGGSAAQVVSASTASKTNAHLAVWDSLGGLVDGGLTVGTTAIASGTNYGVLYNNTGSVLGNTGVGTTGQVLTSNGAGVAPTFQAATGGGNATVATGISAAGTNQGTATVLTAVWTEVSTVGSGQGVLQKTPVLGERQMVANNGANTLLVYPVSGGTFDSLSANAAVSVGVGGRVAMYCLSTTHCDTK